MKDGLPGNPATAGGEAEQAALVTMALIKIGPILLQHPLKLADHAGIEAEALAQQARRDAGVFQCPDEGGRFGLAAAHETQHQNLVAKAAGLDGKNPAPGGPGHSVHRYQEIGESAKCAVDS